MCKSFILGYAHCRFILAKAFCIRSWIHTVHVYVYSWTMVFKSLKFLTKYLILFNLEMMQKNMQASQKRFQGRLKINRQLKRIPNSVTTANNNRNLPQQRRIPSSITTANTRNSDSRSKTLGCNVKHTIKSEC